MRAELTNRTAALEAMADALDEAETLCNHLALLLSEHDPDFVDRLDTETLELWDSVAPFGTDEDG